MTTQVVIDDYGDEPAPLKLNMSQASHLELKIADIRFPNFSNHATIDVVEIQDEPN